MCSRQHKITAVILDKRGRVISMGHNNYLKTHTLQAHYANKVGQPDRIFLHAEMDAIIRAGDKIKQAHTIQVYRFNTKGEARLAKPCPVCMSAILETPIKVIQFTANNGPVPESIIL